MDNPRKYGLQFPELAPERAHNKVMSQDANVCETLNPLYLTDLPSITSITLLILP
jgi:hypothetical protein